MTITTVIPTFRRPALLRRAIESVLAQAYSDVKVCVYDNASGDETENVVTSLRARDARVSYTRRSSNVGAAENFILAAGEIRTPLCSFLSDDDYLLPGFFETAVNALAANPAAGLFAGSTLELDEAGALRYAPLLSWPREGTYASGDAVLWMLGNRHPTWTGVVFRTAALQAAGGLDRGASATLDADAELRVAARSPIVVSFAPCAVYTAHAQRVSGAETAAVIPSLEHMIANIQQVMTLPEDVKERAVAGLQRQLRWKLLEISVKAQVRGNQADARAAASLLRERYGPRWLGAFVGWGLWVCAHVPPAQWLLTWVEHRRVEARAGRARRQVAALGARRARDGRSETQADNT
jgi:hypothetical protein